MQRTRIAKMALKNKRNKAGGLTLNEFKIYKKAAETKAVPYCCEDKYINEIEKVFWK